MTRRNPAGGALVPESAIGGYERLPGPTFGIGTLLPCERHGFVRKGSGGGYYDHAFRDDEPAGTIRCTDCGHTATPEEREQLLAQRPYWNPPCRCSHCGAEQRVEPRSICSVCSDGWMVPC